MSFEGIVFGHITSPMTLDYQSFTVYFLPCSFLGYTCRLVSFALAGQWKQGKSPTTSCTFLVYMLFAESMPEGIIVS